MAVLINANSDESWVGVGIEPQRFDVEHDDFDDEHEVSILYKFVIKIISRMKKYHKRGVEIIDPPEGALKWKVKQPARD
ncbi:MAG: hypothetical protein QMC37_00620 [Flavobacteriales bacterium]|jgi:hypothetical protein|tara:strand:- start:598 stop:834 length:237 start_codon:yes stop_codon:yes gene_type:complete